MSGDRLDNGSWLSPGESLWSPNGSNELRMQEDGKIAVYWDGGCTYQSSEDEHEGIKGLVMQDDGNLVIYDENDEAVWASNTEGSGDSVHLVVQDDGNVVLYQDDEEAVWSSGTVQQQEEQEEEE
ncbi:hypothetical protein FSARC_1333 [Fusarium sarcochroum]|uniref:Bulb-type lectin domain-containing protein n=1 Tax=Fusarium sarcochroum TaxID=1208366 RepID=A0A8H4XEC0_9HYPO|nr:hypothetical protein FSARC_1333 [Fusarium sarcochroum]